MLQTFLRKHWSKVHTTKRMNNFGLLNRSQKTETSSPIHSFIHWNASLHDIQENVGIRSTLFCINNREFNKENFSTIHHAIQSTTSPFKKQNNTCKLPLSKSLRSIRKLNDWSTLRSLDDNISYYRFALQCQPSKPTMNTIHYTLHLSKSLQPKIKSFKNFSSMPPAVQNKLFYSG